MEHIDACLCTCGCPGLALAIVYKYTATQALKAWFLCPGRGIGCRWSDSTCSLLHWLLAFLSPRRRRCPAVCTSICRITGFTPSAHAAILSYQGSFAGFWHSGVAVFLVWWSLSPAYCWCLSSWCRWHTAAQSSCQGGAQVCRHVWSFSAGDCDFASYKAVARLSPWGEVKTSGY